MKQVPPKASVTKHSQPTVKSERVVASPAAIKRKPLGQKDTPLPPTTKPSAALDVSPVPIQRGRASTRSTTSAPIVKKQPSSITQQKQRTSSPLSTSSSTRSRSHSRASRTSSSSSASSVLSSSSHHTQLRSRSRSRSHSRSSSTSSSSAHEASDTDTESDAMSVSPGGQTDVDSDASLRDTNTDDSSSDAKSRNRKSHVQQKNKSKKKSSLSHVKATDHEHATGLVAIDSLPAQTKPKRRTAIIDEDADEEEHEDEKDGGRNKLTEGGDVRDTQEQEHGTHTDNEINPGMHNIGSNDDDDNNNDDDNDTEDADEEEDIDVDVHGQLYNYEELEDMDRYDRQDLQSYEQHLQYQYQQPPHYHHGRTRMSRQVAMMKSQYLRDDLIHDEPLSSMEITQARLSKFNLTFMASEEILLPSIPHPVAPEHSACIIPWKNTLRATQLRHHFENEEYYPLALWKCLHGRDSVRKWHTYYDEEQYNKIDIPVIYIWRIAGPRSMEMEVANRAFLFEVAMATCMYAHNRLQNARVTLCDVTIEQPIVDPLLVDLFIPPRGERGSLCNVENGCWFSTEWGVASLPLQVSRAVDMLRDAATSNLLIFSVLNKWQAWKIANDSYLFPSCIRRSTLEVFRACVHAEYYMWRTTTQVRTIREKIIGYQMMIACYEHLTMSMHELRTCALGVRLYRLVCIAKLMQMLYVISETYRNGQMQESIEACFLHMVTQCLNEVYDAFTNSAYEYTEPAAGWIIRMGDIITTRRKTLANSLEVQISDVDIVRFTQSYTDRMAQLNESIGDNIYLPLDDCTLLQHQKSTLQTSATKSKPVSKSKSKPDSKSKSKSKKSEKEKSYSTSGKQSDRGVSKSSSAVAATAVDGDSSDNSDSSSSSSSCSESESDDDEIVITPNRSDSDSTSV